MNPFEIKISYKNKDWNLENWNLSEDEIDEGNALLEIFCNSEKVLSIEDGIYSLIYNFFVKAIPQAVIFKQMSYSSYFYNYTVYLYLQKGQLRIDKLENNGTYKTVEKSITDFSFDIAFAEIGSKYILEFMNYLEKRNYKYQKKDFETLYIFLNKSYKKLTPEDFNLNVLLEKSKY